MDGSLKFFLGSSILHYLMLILFDTHGIFDHLQF